MALLILSFMAGVLTVAAPCILPLLPVIVGGSLLPGKSEKNWLRPIVITGSLAASVVLFTLLLKATTALLGVPQVAWQIFSGGIVILLGVSFLKPELWESLPLINRLNLGSNRLLSKSYQSSERRRDVLIGLSLGPVFASCSPTYALIVATVLPAEFFKGLIYLAAYALGLASTLLIISFAGQSLVTKLNWLSNPGGWFRRGIGLLFIVVGLVVLFGIDKKIQTYILEQGWYDPIGNFEKRLRN